MSSIAFRIRTQMRRFVCERDGALAAMAGITIPVVLLVSGAATDYSRAVEANARAQRALDATMLRLANANIDPQEIQAEGVAAFETALALADPALTATQAKFAFGADKDGNGEPDTITGFSEIVSRNYFMGIFGSPQWVSQVSSEIVQPEAAAQEIALVLDVSGSMNDDLNGKPRIDRLREAIDNMFTAIDENKSKLGEVSIAIVPYSTSVNIADVSGSVTESLSVGGNAPPPVGNDIWAAERSNGTTATGFALNDDAPSLRPIPFVGAGEIHDATPLSRFAPLTSDANKYKNAIKSLTASGWTAAHLGVIWGVYALSPNWSSVWPQDPKPYGGAQKTIVLLTDGEFNTTHAVGAKSTSDGDTSNSYLQSACALARDKGVTIFTVALSLDATSEARLAACSNGSGGRMFSADNAAELKNAFEEIGAQIGRLRITS